MRLKSTLLLIPFTFGLCSMAYGQDGEAPPVRVINIDNPDEITGEAHTPGLIILSGDPEPTSSSLVELRWSFADKLVESGEEIR